MKRTSQALRRFGVPVLAATTFLSVGQVALGTSTFAAGTNGTLTITTTSSNTGGTATPNSGDGHVTQRVVTDQTAPQTITLTLSGSAYFAATQPSQTNATLTLGSGTHPQTATCVTASTGTGCNYNVDDTTSEVTTVTAVNSTNNTAVSATATSQISFASLYWTSCSQTTQNDSSNCVTQAAKGATTTLTVTYKTGGQPAANVGVTFSDENGNGTISPSQPAGTAFFDTDTANCITNAQGQCSVNVFDNTVETNDYSAITNNTGGFPASFAEIEVNVLTSTTPGRLVQTNSVLIEPGAGGSGDAMPGDVVENTYELDSCLANSTTGENICQQGDPLAGVSVALTLDHGFFTAPCTSANGAVTNYENCTFNTTPTAGTKVGDIKSAGTTKSVTTDQNGQFTVFEGIGRDAGFDDDGIVDATVTGVASGVTLHETNPSQSAPANDCTANPGDPGCASSTEWTTDDAPLNGGAVKFNWITTPALPDSGTTEIQENGVQDFNVFTLSLTDQFGNLTSGGGGASLTASGAGRLFACTGSPAYSSTDPCIHDTTALFSQPSGTPTYTIDPAFGSYTMAFDAAGHTVQDRYGIDSFGSVSDGTQTLKASWDAPVTTFKVFTAGTATTPALATYDSTTTTLTDTVTVDYYKPVPTTFTFATTPSNTVHAGTVVTVSATVLDQKGKGIPGLTANFIRSGPQTQSGTSCTATQASPAPHTNDAGQAGFSFTCTNPSNQVVTVIITDASGNELKRSTQAITFTGTAPRRTIVASIHCKSPRSHVLVCKVTVTPHIAGLTVNFHRNGQTIGTAKTNSNGVATLTKKHLKSHKKWTVSAHVVGTGATKPANTGTSSATIK